MKIQGFSPLTMGYTSIPYNIVYWNTIKSCLWGEGGFRSSQRQSACVHSVCRLENGPIAQISLGKLEMKLLCLLRLWGQGMAFSSWAILKLKECFRKPSGAFLRKPLEGSGWTKSGGSLIVPDLWVLYLWIYAQIVYVIQKLI